MKEEKTYTYIFYDILDNILQLSENPSQFAEYLSQQIRGIIGARTIVITIKDEKDQPLIFSVFPKRKKEWCQQPAMLELAEMSFDFKKIQYLSNEFPDKKIVQILSGLEIEKTIAIPLIAANRMVGSILLMDIMDLFGIDAVIDLLSRLSGVFALIIRNSILYHNLEGLVAKRTSELQNRNTELLEREYQLKTANEEYETLNEELSENIEKVKEINLKLEEAKKKAEEEEKRFRAIFENSQDAIGISNKGVNVFFNNAYMQLFGYGSEDELTGISVLTLIAKKEHDKIADYIKKRANGEDAPIHYQAIGTKKNGEEFPFEINVGNYRLNNENFTIAIIRDISARKSYESNLKLAKEKAEESDRLKTAFLQNMSHEIRTPMNSIIGFSKLLEKKELSQEKRNGFTSIIQNNAQQLLSIINDILSISSLETKQEKINFTNVSINNIIVELLANYQVQAFNQNISLYAKQQLTNEQSVIYSDGTKLKQILNNLLTNALKFTHTGSIEIGYHLVENKKLGDEILFFIKDTGIGIKHELQEKIFERFRQADQSPSKKYGGTGLGLSISKGLVELLGGKIWVKSEPGNGSAFYFSIPYKPVNEPERNINATLIKSNKKTILVAEDEEYNFLLIEELLIDQDYLLIHAKNGKEAIEICEANSSVKLVLMDIKMPVVSGDIAAKKIKEIHPGLPIIAQSAYGLEHEIKKYSGIFDDYVTKPFDEDQLISKINQYMLK